MKGFVKIALAFALAMLPGMAQRAEDDPNGWTKAKWGITRDQVIAEFPGAADIPAMKERDFAAVRRIRPDVVMPTILALKSFDISGYRFQVRFRFSKTDGGLEAVDLSDPSGPRPDTPYEMIQEGAKDMLLSALVDKYGKETKANEEKEEGIVKSVTETWEWIFPSTVVKLSWWHNDSAHKSSDMTYLSYTRRKKVDGL